MAKGTYLAAIMLLLGAAPAMAQSGAAPAAVPAPSVGAVNDALTRYGKFAQQLSVAEQPALAAFSVFGEEIRAAMAGSDHTQTARRVHVLVDRTLAAVASADSQIAAVQLVEVPEMKLPAELQPMAQRQAIRTLNAQMRVAITSFGPTVDALARNDPKAAMASARSMISNLKLVLDTQALLARGQAAAVTQESGTRELLEFEAAYYHLASRLLGAYRLDGARVANPALANDMTAIATQVDGLRETRHAQIEAMVVRMDAAAADALARGDTARAALAERMSRVFQAGRPSIGLMEQFSAIARRAAATFRSKPVDAATVKVVMGELKAVQQGIVALGAAESDIAGSTTS